MNSDLQRPYFRSSSRVRFALRATIAWPVAIAMPLACTAALAGGALPTGASVTAGKVVVTAPAAGTVLVKQTSERGVVHWTSFDVGQGSRVNFAQPDAGAATLNIVNGPDASLIAGTLQSTGSIFLVNPSGITISPTGTVAAGSGFVASTLAISDADFMNGVYRFNGKGGAVVNQGRIGVASGGAVVLLGGNVDNDGVIDAPIGRVALGSGSAATLDLKGDGFLQVLLPADATTADGRALVSNGGVIQADGGTVALMASTVGDALRNAINMPGTIRARSVSGHDGAVMLEGGAAGSVNISGSIDASATAGAVDGGKVDVSGAALALQGASIAATGVDQGGLVRIGGAFQGGKAQDPDSERTSRYIGRFGATSALQTAATTDIDATSSIDVSATGANGVGGTAVVWSDKTTVMQGSLVATGQKSGGAAEVSSGSQIQSIALRKIAVGAGGSLLLDPQEINIDDSETTGPVGNLGYGDSPTATTTILSSDIVALLSAGTNLTLQANDSIAWSTTSSVVTPAPGHVGGNLTLAAGNSITLSGAFTTGGGNWSMTGNEPATAGVVSAERLPGSAVVSIENAVFSGNNGRLTLSLLDGNGNPEQDARGIFLGQYSGAGVTATIEESAFDFSTSRTPQIFVTANMTATGDIDLAGNLLFNGQAFTTLSAQHVNWDASNTIEGEGSVEFVENGVMTRYGSLRGTDAVRLDIGRQLNGLSRTYGDADFAIGQLGVQLQVDPNSARQPSDDLSLVLAAGSLAATGPGATANAGASAITITPTSSFAISNGLSTGYFIDTAPAAVAMTITPRAITAGSLSASYVYGSASPAVIGFNNVVNGDNLTPIATVNGIAGVALTNAALPSGEQAGTQQITVTSISGPKAADYTFTAPAPFTATVTPKALTWDGVASSQVYGSNSLPAPALVGIVGSDQVAPTGETISTITSVQGGESLTRPVGSYSVGLAGLSGAQVSNYTLAASGNVNGTVTITPKTLTLAPVSASSVYGTALTLAGLPAATLVGVVPGDVMFASGQLYDSGGHLVDFGPQFGQLQGGSYTFAVAPGFYGGQGAANYTLSGTAQSFGTAYGALQVTPKPLTWSTPAESTTYGSTGPTFATLQGVVPGDSVTSNTAVVDAFGNTVTQINAGGTYFSAVTSLNAIGQDYSIATTGNSAGAITVARRPITYTVSDTDAVYGTLASASHITLNNVVPGDSIAYQERITSGGVTIAYTDRTSVGTYTDTVTGLNGLLNYVLAPTGNQDGMLTIAPKQLTLTVPDVSSVYGTQAQLGQTTVHPDPVTFLLPGVLPGDQVGALQPVLHATQTFPAALTNAGTYAIDEQLVGPDARNYVAADVGTLTVAPKTITYLVQAAQGATLLGASQVYGSISAAQPTANVSFNGLVGSDTLGLATSATTIPRSTSGNLDAGTYAFAATSSTLTGSAASNYVLATTGNVNQSLTITPKPLDFALTSQIPAGQAVYGSSDQIGVFGSYNASEIKGNDQVGFQFGFSTPEGVVAQLPARQEVGTYPLVLFGGLSAADGANYAAVVRMTPVVVAPKPVTVVIDPSTTTYGNTPVLPGFGVVGLLSGDTLSLGIEFTTTTLFPRTPAGTYPVSLSNAPSPGTVVGNYVMTAGGGTTGLPVGNFTSSIVVNPVMLGLSVNQAALNLTYGDAVPVSAITGLLPNDQNNVDLFTYAVPLTVHGVAAGANANIIGLPSSQFLNAGTYDYDAVLQGPMAADYRLPALNYGTITVARKPVTVTTGAVSATYGATTAPSVMFNGLIGGDAFAPAVTTSNAAGTAITYTGQTDTGSYTNHVTGFTNTLATPRPAGSDLNYVFVDTPSDTAALTVAPKAITFTAPSNGVTATYGDTSTLGALSGVQFNDDVSVQVSGLLSTRLTGNADGTQSYATKTDVGTYTYGTTTLAGAKSRDYTLAGPAVTGSLTIVPRTVTWTVGDASMQYGGYAVPACTIAACPLWQPETGPGTAHFANVVAGDTLGGSVAVVDAAGHALTLDGSVQLGTYSEQVTALTGTTARDYTIAASGNKNGNFTVVPQYISYSTTSAFYLPGSGFIGTGGTLTLYGPNGTNTDPDLGGTVVLMDGNSHQVASSSAIASGGHYIFTLNGLIGADARNYQINPGFTGAGVANDPGTLDIYASAAFGLGLTGISTPPPAPPAQSAPSGLTTDMFSNSGTSGSASISLTGANASGSASASATGGVSLGNGVELTGTASASASGSASAGPTGLDVSASASADASATLQIGPGTLTYGYAVDADGEATVGPTGLNANASVSATVYESAGVNGSAGPLGDGNASATGTVGAFAHAEGNAGYSDGQITQSLSTFDGAGANASVDAGLSGSSGSIDAGVTVYTPGSIGGELQSSAGYSNGAVSLSMDVGVDTFLFGGVNVNFSLSFDPVSMVNSIANSSAFNDIAGALGLDTSPLPVTGNFLRTVDAAEAYTGDPAARFAYLSANTAWHGAASSEQYSEDPVLKARVDSDNAFYNAYLSLVNQTAALELKETTDAAKVLALIASGDNAGAAAYAHANMNVASEQRQEASIQAQANALGVVLAVNNGNLTFSDK